MTQSQYERYRSQQGYELALQIYTEQLADLQVPYTLKQVTTTAGETNILLAGDERNPPIIMFHGNASNLTMWIDQVNRLSTDFYLIVPDIPGHTGHSAPTIINRDDDSYSQWIETLLDELSIKQVHIIGISYGGWVSLRFASQRPKRVKSLFLLSSGGILRAGWRFWLKIIGVFTSPPSQRGVRFAKAMSAPNYQPSDMENRVFNIITTHHKAQGEPPVEPDQHLQAITAPTCMYTGAYDPIFNPQKSINRLHENLQNFVRGEILPDVGHGILGEKPEWVAQTIREWVTQHS